MATGFQAANTTTHPQMMELEEGRVESGDGAVVRGNHFRRQQGDYDDFVDFAYDDVQTWYEQAEGFVTRISDEVEILLKASPGEDGCSHA